jgi:ABC-type ATPase involved in cell division
VRGIRSSIAKKKLDVVLEAIRIEEGSRKIQFIRGFRRRGVVWGDWQLFDTSEVVDFLRSGLRVATGRPGSLQGDFEIIAKVQLHGKNGDQKLIVEGDEQHLGLPLL